jgi:hypothetical protein
MHEVDRPSLLTELLVAFETAGGLCLRLSGPVTSLLGARSGRLVLLLSAPEVRQVPVHPSWVAVDELAEAIVPVADLGAEPGCRIEFCLQVRDASDAVLETVPASGSWTVVIPQAGPPAADWQL